MFWISMRAERISLAAILVTAAIVMTSCFTSGQSDELIFYGLAEDSLGDYYRYNYTEGTLPDVLGENVLDILYGYSKNIRAAKQLREFSTEDVLTVDGKEVHCLVGVANWSISFVSYSNYGGDMVFPSEYIWEMRVWVSDSDNVVCSETTDKLYVNTVVEGEDGLGFEGIYPYYSYESVIRKNYTSAMIKNLDYPLRVGEEWSRTDEYEKTTIESERVGLGGWDTDISEETITEVWDFEVLEQNRTEVPAGTFDCLVVREQVRGESDYRVVYYDANGISVQSFDFHYGDVQLAFELAEYHMRNEGVIVPMTSSDDYRTLLPSIVCVTAAACVITIMLLRRRPRKPMVDTKAPDSGHPSDVSTSGNP